MPSISKTISVHNIPPRTTGCKQPATRSAKTGASGLVANNFLKTTFHPLLKRGWNYQKNQTPIETSFYSSLTNLCRCYHLTEWQLSTNPYPVNIKLDYQKAVHFLAEKNQDLDLTIVETSPDSIALATKKYYETGCDLYYIPVEPVAKLLAGKRTRKSGNLLLSIFAWLFKIVDIDYYREEQSHIHYVYTAIEDNLLENDGEYESEDFKDCENEIKSAKIVGDAIYKHLLKPDQLTRWAYRLKSYHPTTDWEKRLHELASLAFAIYQEFPNSSLKDQIPERHWDDYNDNDLLELYQYTGFCYSLTGWLSDQTDEWCNASFQDMSKDNPVSYQVFDQPYTTTQHDFTFEDKVFTLLDDIVYHLCNNK